MKQRIIFSLVIVFLSSCSIVHKRAETEVPVVQEETPVEAPRPKAAIKKTISDRDLKKDQENQELKKRIVVLPLLDRKGIHDLTVLRNARTALVDTLNTTENMIALDPSVLKLSLDKYVKDNMYDLKAIAKDSQTVGVSALLEGRIVDMRFKGENETVLSNTISTATKPVAFDVVVQARMVNIRSGQELFNMVKTISVDDEESRIPESTTADSFFVRNTELTELLVKEAFMDYTDQLEDALKTITWEGRIAAFQGDRIFLNVGRISGVQVGDILKVVDDGNEIYDPELGYHVGKVQGRVKGTLEIVDFFGQDGAVGVIHSGAGFKENDRIEIY